MQRTNTGAVYTPTLVHENMNRVNDYVNALNIDYQAKQPDKTILGQWNTFKTGWDKFFADNQSLYNPLDWRPTYDMSESYRVQAVSWQKALTDAGIPTGTPLPIPAAPPPGYMSLKDAEEQAKAERQKQKDEDSGGLPWGWIALGAGALGVVYFGAQYAKGKVGEARQALTLL